MTTEETASQAGRKAPIKTSGIQKILLVFFGLGLFGLSLAMIEGVLGVLDVGEPYTLQDPYVGFQPGITLFELSEDGAVLRTRTEKLAYFNAQKFAAKKDPETIRIFALGGSTTAGRPYDWQVSFPKWLEIFAHDAGARHVEVINAGGVSYASYRIAVLMQELVNYQPDAFVIYTGHNELLEERTYSNLIREAPWRRNLRVWSNGLRSVNLLRKGFESEPVEPEAEIASEVQAKLDVWNGLDLFERDEELQQSVLTHFEHHLRQMAALADAVDVPLIWIRPISNLKDFSPFKSQPSDGLSEPAKLDFQAKLAEGKNLSAQEDPRAIGALREATDLDPLYAESAFRLGEALLADRQFGEAETWFIKAKDLDVCPLRALETTDQILQKVVRETAGTLVDLPTYVQEENARRLGHQILGDEMLVDHVHPTIEVHRWIAAMVLKELSDIRLVEIEDGWSQGDAETEIERHMAGLDELYYARRDLNLSKVLGWAGKFEEALGPSERAVQYLFDDPEAFRNLGIVYQKLGQPADALQAHQRAVELDVSIPESHFNLGVVLAEMGQWRLAAQSLKRALEIHPEYREAAFNLAIALRELGDTEASKAIFEELDELGWYHSSMDRQQAMVAVQEAKAHSAEGRLEAAETAFRRGLGFETEPRFRAKAHNDLGVLYARWNRLEEAEAELRRALEIDGSYGEALFNLGLVSANVGELVEARRFLERAIDLEPGNPRFQGALRRLDQAAGRR